MKRVNRYQEVISENSSPYVVTIGNFDGVHIGHRALLSAARCRADSLGISLAVLTFAPHPIELLQPDAAQSRLVTPEKKLSLLRECHVDLAVFQTFDAAFAALDPEAFVRVVLVEALEAKLVYVGENFRFGKGREAGVGALSRFGRRFGFDVYSAELIQSGKIPVSSSRIRDALSEGDVTAASRMLGRHHEITGIVARDRQFGKKMGFPTINLNGVSVMLPKPGIYAALAEVGEKSIPAAAYIGDRPTTGSGFSIEAHLLDFEGDLYEETATLRLVERIRDDRKFNDIDQLTRQIADDIERIRGIIKKIHD
jgi:riboflavin kinase/FMN adenylyltransferase